MKSMGLVYIQILHCQPESMQISGTECPPLLVTLRLNISDDLSEQYLTHVIVSCDGHGSSSARTLLGEMVAELEDAGVVLQHRGNLHLNWVSQLLPLYQREEEHSKPTLSSLLIFVFMWKGQSILIKIQKWIMFCMSLVSFIWFWPGCQSWAPPVWHC